MPSKQAINRLLKVDNTPGYRSNVVPLDHSLQMNYKKALDVI